MKKLAIGKFLRKNQHTIVVVAGTLLLCGAAVMAFKDAEKVKNGYKKYEEEHPDPEDDNFKDFAKDVLKPMAKTAGVAAAGVTLIMTGTFAQAKEVGKLARDLYIEKDKNEKLFKKIKDEIGEKRAKEIRHEVKKSINEEYKGMDYEPKENPRLNSTEQQWFVADWQDKPFISSIADICNAVNAANARSIRDGEVTVNELHYEMGLNPMRSTGDLGWYSGELIELAFDPIVYDGRVMMGISFYNEPHIL